MSDSKSHPPRQAPSNSPAELIAEVVLRWLDSPHGDAQDLAAQEIIATLTAAGYAILPREATEEMIDGGYRKRRRGGPHVFRDTWKAMTDAFLAGCGR